MSDDKPHAGGSKLTSAFRKAQQEARVRSSHIGLPSYNSGSAPRSGVHPDAAGMVLCPYCAKKFSYSAALLNRALRCSGCRNAFRVSEDRRTFKFQDASAPVTPDVGAISKGARVAIKQANASLNDAAAAAMRSLGRMERPSPPGSGTALRAAVKPNPPVGTGRHTNKSAPPVLTGEGDRKAVGLKRFQLLVMATLIIVVSLVLALQTDERHLTLAKFMKGRNWTSLQLAVGDMHPAGKIAPIIGLDNASISRDATLDLTPVHAELSGMNYAPTLSCWIDDDRYREALTLAGDLPATEAARTAALGRISKAGIRIKMASDIIAMAERSAPVETLGVLGKLLTASAASSTNAGSAEPAATRGLPDSIVACTFHGPDGTLLQPIGANRHPVSYSGRMVRLQGNGWPASWSVFDLQIDPKGK
jgi:hypothetical protein